jgi:sugar phosphate isomerase/epimerase
VSPRRALAAAERGADHGVEICVENLPSGPFTIDAFDDFLDRTDVPVTLDTGHAVLAGWTEAEVAALVREWPDRVSHVHLNDTRATAEAWAADDEPLPFGAGTVDFETLLAPAVDGDWTPSLTLEVVTWDDDYLDLSASRLHDLV